MKRRIWDKILKIYTGWEGAFFWKFYRLGNIFYIMKPAFWSKDENKSGLYSVCKTEEDWNYKDK